MLPRPFERLTAATTILADTPESGQEATGHRDWRRMAGPSPELAVAWRTLAPPGRPWIADRDQDTDEPPPWTVIVVDRAPRSQFDLLQDLGPASVAAGPLACLALCGSRFHGLRNRPWSARRGNVHLSVALPVGAEVASLGPGLSVLPALAVVDALSEVTAGRLTPTIKWVNDLLVDNAKLAGVLSASRIRGTTVESAVYGIGLNLAVAPTIRPTVFVPAATCVHHQLGAETVGAPEMVDALLSALDARHRQLLDRGPAPLLAAYRQHSAVIGRRVAIWPEESGPPEPPARIGEVASINNDLSLTLAGQTEPVTSGRLACRAPGSHAADPRRGSGR